MEEQQNENMKNPEEFMAEQQKQREAKMQELMQKIEPLQKGELDEESGKVLASLVADVPRALGQISEQQNQLGGMTQQVGQITNMLIEYINGLGDALKMENFDEWNKRLQQESSVNPENVDVTVKRKSGIIT